MNDYEYIARTIRDLLEKESAVVLATVVGLQGSSPRHTGARMVFDQNGRSYGTIGGSLLEATAIKEAWSVLASRQSKFMYFDMTGKEAPSGMICGGRAEVLLDYIPSTLENIALFKNWLEALQNSQNFFFLTHLKDNGKSVQILGHALLFRDGTVSGNQTLKPEDIAELSAELHNFSRTEVISLGETQVMVDPIRKLKTVYCFGAGHVAVPTAHIAALAGFRVIATDDRAEFANAERFPEAYSVRVIPDFLQALEGLEIDKDSYIVILTRGHQFDREVLEQALKTRAGYIGMISSRKKRDSIYQSLREEGFTDQDLARVYSPIGIKIGGETPEEIAVSIVAELIAVRAKQA